MTTQELRDPTHPIWILLRQCVACLAVLAVLALNYNHFDQRDISSTLYILSSIFGFDLMKTKFANGTPRVANDNKLELDRAAEQRLET